MKNKLHFIIAVAIVCTSFTCQAQVVVKTKVIKRFIPHFVTNNVKTRIADRLQAQLKNCCDSQGCGMGSSYCDNDQCPGVVMTCHHVEAPTFDSLTADQDGLSKPFSLTQINRVLNASNCQSQKIELFSDDESGTQYYYLKNVDTSFTDNTHQYFAFYSYFLLKTLVNNGLKSMTLYRGFQTTDKKYIVVFSATFSDGSVKLFDVSDTQP
ncbi:MAG TPA: hypothetical protein VHA52_08135 [Candidatus Babeliaceae bacterium]|nr:hypothetical protein [Candidatus Babeliaceae bacterium]